MKISRLLAAALLVISAPSMAVTVETFYLGDLHVPGVTVVTNSYSQPGPYQDDYEFFIAENASASGLVLELDSWWNKLDLAVTSISLTGVGSFSLLGNLGIFDFGTLSAGSYTLSIFSTVSGTPGLLHSDVGYAGLLALRASGPTEVPEPGTLALLGLGLIGVAMTTRRRATAK